MAKIVILFKDKNTGRWEKVIAKDQEEKEVIIALHVEETPFVKRYCIIGRGTKTPFDSEEEAMAAKQEGDVVQVMAPPSNFSEKSQDVEFYYHDENSGDEASIDPQDYEDLPIAEEDMMTDLVEGDETPIKDDEKSSKK